MSGSVLPTHSFSDSQSASFDAGVLEDAAHEGWWNFFGTVMTEWENPSGYRRKPNQMIPTFSFNVASCSPQ